MGWLGSAEPPYELSQPKASNETMPGRTAPTSLAESPTAEGGLNMDANCTSGYAVVAERFGQ